MVERESYAALLAEVSAATGELPDDTLGRIICAVDGESFGRTLRVCGDDGSDELRVEDGSDRWTYTEYRSRCPDVSIDAALLILTYALPEHGYSIRRVAPGVKPVVTLYAPPEAPDAPIDDGRSWSRHTEGAGATPALAVLAALLSAKIAEEADHAG